jgi:hypothetical protein
MSQQGLVHLVWYVAWVFLWTIVVRGVLALGVRFLARRLPDTIGALNEVERYGWWISLVLGAMIAVAF